MSPNMRRTALLLAILMFARSAAAQEPPAAEPASPPPPTAAPVSEPPAAVILNDPPALLRPVGRGFVEIGFEGGFPRLDGTRSVPAAYQPVFPQRIPWMNFGEIAGNVAFAGRIGYRMAPPLGELFAGLSHLGGEFDVIYANGDPLLDRVGGNPVIDALNRRSTSDEDTDDAPPPIRPGGFDPAGAALAYSRIDRTVVDLGYGNRLPLGPLDVVANVGGRLGIFYHQDRSLGLGISSFTSTHFLGGGPLYQMELRWWSTRPDLDGDRGGWHLCTRVGGSVLFGRVRQSYREAVGFPYLPSYIDVRGESPRTVPTFEVECGVAFRPFSERTFLRLGYRYEKWWNLGGLDPDRYSLATHSFVLRLTTPY